MGFRQAIIGVSRVRDWKCRAGPSRRTGTGPGQAIPVGGPGDTAERAGGG